ncbi:hypothetical protein M1328_05295 [Patescibacteria group bacterium]|nr:hypothetical protein [Patescibacteria group bacterium]
MARRENLVSKLEREHGESKKLWFTSSRDGMLIVIPSLAKNDLASLLSKKHHPGGIIKLDRPPEPHELSNFSGIVALESNPGTGDPLTTRAVWQTNNGPTALGGIFTSQQPYLEHFETLSGVLFPSQISYQGPVNGEIIEPWIRALSRNTTLNLTKVLSLDEQKKSLESLLHLNRQKKVTIAIYGLGDIGSFVAQSLYSQSSNDSGINRLILASKSRNTVEAMKIELEDIGLERDAHPSLIGVTQDNIEEIFAADIILFLASGPIPPADSTSMNVDVRAVQYSANVKILRELLQHASKVNWGGTLLVASDPVEQLAMAALQSSVSYNHNNQRIAGFGAAINYGRARRQAEEMGLSTNEVRVFGAHGKSVVAVPSLKGYDKDAAEKLSLRTGLRNYRVREQLKKPWRAPAAWMSNALQNLLKHEQTWASSFLPGNGGKDDNGAFFGSRSVGDVHLHLWDVGTGGDYNPDIMDVLTREHRFISLTSRNPVFLFVDPFHGESDPNRAKHIAFHEDAMEEWLNEAGLNASLINTTDLALSTRSQELTMRIEKAIVENDLETENLAKQELLKLIGASLHRSERDVIEEKTTVIAEGVLGGELLSNVSYRQLAGICKSIAEKVDIKSLINRTISILGARREPEVDVINLSEVKTTTLLEGLKHPHLVNRMKNWQLLAQSLKDGFEISPAMAKKIMTLVNFGDDFTLYQISTSETTNIESVKFLYDAQLEVLNEIHTRMNGYNGVESSDAIIFGTTGAPFGQHHVKTIKSGFQAIKERYSQSQTEAFIALDDFSRSKAEAIVNGQIPSLALRRRIALLQSINEDMIYLVNPAIPIWFDINNVHLLEQIQKEVAEGETVWRLIGGDSLKNYPRSNLYSSIPHIVDVRGEDRKAIDSLLNRMRFREYLLTDNVFSSSTQIRQDLKSGINSKEINDLTAAFIKHYNLFQ